MSRGMKWLKACMKCKALVRVEEERCPVCGSTEFSEEWSGMVIIIDPKRSRIAKLLGIEKPGRYALKVGV